MTVYFVQELGKSDGPIKIGFAADIQVRLRNLASSFKEGLSLLATAEGGREIERAFHLVLKSDRLEGEWFSYSPAVKALMEPLRLSERVVFRGAVSRREALEGQGTRSQDAELAAMLLAKLFSHHPVSSSLSRALEDAYSALADINPVWSRRRVKAIWAHEAHRIEFFEICDLVAASGAEWSEILPEIKREDGR